MTQVIGQSWVVLGALAAVLGCAGNKPVASGAPAVLAASAAPAPPAAATPRERPELDSERPEYWASHVGEPDRYEQLYPRLKAFFGDDNLGSDESAPKPDYARVVEPLTRSYVEHSSKLDSKQRGRLMALLWKTRDARSEPAVKLALSQYVEGRFNGEEPRDVRYALRLAYGFKLESCRGLLLRVFLKYRQSEPLDRGLHSTLPLALLDLADASWLPALSQKLAEPMEPPADGAVVDDDALSEQEIAYIDRSFWQTSAISVLARLRDPRAIEPLVQVLLDPAKQELHDAALLALTAIGRPALARALSLAQLSGVEAQVGGRLLGELGLAEGTEPLLAALNRAQRPIDRAFMANALSRLPANARSLTAFKRAYESVPLKTSLRDSLADPLDAREALADAARSFADPQLVPWLLLQGERARGNDVERAGARLHLFASAIYLATPAQMPSVKKTVARWGAPDLRVFVEEAERAMADCREDADCYVRSSAALGKGDLEPKTATPLRAYCLKSLYRLAQLGKPEHAAQLAELIHGDSDAALAWVASHIIDHLVPSGSKPLEDRLSLHFVTQDGHSWSGNVATIPLERTLYRLRIRSSPPTPAP